MQVADPRKGKAVKPFRFAVGVLLQMQGTWLQQAELVRVLPRSQR